MKQIKLTLKLFSVVVLSVLVAGCASSNQLEEQKRIAYSAGFKVINPAKPDQVALLPKLPKDKVTPINYKGKTYYILPDAGNNQAFVGGQIEFRRYQKLCMDQQIQAQINAAEAAEEWNQMNWGAWGGWGAVGYYPRVLRY